MNCPNCRKKLTPDHLRESKACADWIASRCAVLMVSKRRTDAGGRPKTPRPCPRCGAMCAGTREARAHCQRK